MSKRYQVFLDWLCKTTKRLSFWGDNENQCCEVQFLWPFFFFIFDVKKNEVKIKKKVLCYVCQFTNQKSANSNRVCSWVEMITYTGPSTKREVVWWGVFQTTGHQFYPSLTEVTNIFCLNKINTISSEYKVKSHGLQGSAKFSECRYMMTWNENMLALTWKASVYL